MNQIKDGDNLVSLILGETLLGLDAVFHGGETLLGLDAVFHGGETHNFLGSPLTLQIWLMERLDMIAKPTTNNYGPNSFLSGAVIKTECQTKSDWVKFIQETQYLNSMGLLLVEVPTPSTKVFRVISHLPCWVVEGNFLLGR